MQNMTDIQPTGTPDIRKSHIRSRQIFKIALYSFGCSLLLSVLLGLHNTASAAPSQALSASTALASHAISITTSRLSANAVAQRAISTTYHNVNEAYGDTAWQAAVNAGIDPNRFIRQINQESGFNPNAYSPAGAEGIAQFMPATAATMGVNPWDPTSALYGAARLMAQLSQQFGGNYAQALAAYNAGPGAVQYAISVGGGSWYYYLPAETQNYVTIIMGW